jgi:hypothetical protein
MTRNPLRSLRHRVLSCPHALQQQDTASISPSAILARNSTVARVTLSFCSNHITDHCYVISMFGLGKEMKIKWEGSKLANRNPGHAAHAGCCLLPLRCLCARCLPQSESPVPPGPPVPPGHSSPSPILLINCVLISLVTHIITSYSPYGPTYYY